MSIKKYLSAAALILTISPFVQADRMVTIFELDGQAKSANELAQSIDPRTIKAVKQQTLLADGLFHFDKADINRLTHNHTAFKALADEARANHYTIRIDAFADELGKSGYNQKLSQRRAKAVADYFNRSFGIPFNQMTYQGWGENYPIVDCKITPKLLRDKISRQQIIDCLAPNRRVTISLLGA